VLTFNSTQSINYVTHRELFDLAGQVCRLIKVNWCYYRAQPA